MDTKELAVAIAAMQQLIDELRLAVEALRTQQAMQLRTQPQRREHLDRAKRIDAVARLSAKYPQSRSLRSGYGRGCLAPHYWVPRRKI